MTSRSISLLLVVALALGAFLLGDRNPVAPEPEGRAPAAAATTPDPTERAVSVPSPAPVRVEVDQASGSLYRADNRHAAGRRVARAVARTDHGIRCPDGSFLPLLNGVESAPPVMRSDDRGPLAPVVAVVTDADGWDWYEHADGATTTCRPQFIVDAAGNRSVRVLTLHNAPDRSMREAPDPPLREHR